MEDTIRALQAALDLHDPGERAHAERVSVYAVATGEKLGLSDDDLVQLKYAAQLHDVGKMNVDKTLLRKIGELTDEDFAALRYHAEAAVEVLREFTFLSDAVGMIKHHHERWDGNGYPEGLAGDAIPLGARILAVAEAFDVMTTSVIWKSALSPEEALNEVRACSGAQFDPQVVEAFSAIQPLIQPIGYR